jgi:hypothetical protein
VLSTALRVLVRCWPALLAWFLLGWTLRALLIRLAGFVGATNDTLGQLVLPLAILVQLAAYVGMFLAIRRELPQLQKVDDPEAGEIMPPPARRWGDTLLAAILPFFVLYVAWDLIHDDLVDYRFSILGQADLSKPLNFAGFDAVTIGIVVAAIVLRWLIGRFSARLPRWTAAIASYLEAVWSLLALLLISGLLARLGEWLSTRRMFAWAVDGWAQLRAAGSWLSVVADGIAWLAEHALPLITLPLAWLAFAAIIYFGTLPRRARATTARMARAQERWSSAPVWARRAATLVSSGFLDRWRPVALAARLIWSAGPLAIGLYLLAFAVVTAAGEWLRLLIYRLAGPHSGGWWYGASDGYELAVKAVVGVLQVALVAAAFEHALRSDAASEVVETAGDAVSSAAAPAAERSTN